MPKDRGMMNSVLMLVAAGLILVLSLVYLGASTLVTETPPRGLAAVGML